MKKFTRLTVIVVSLLICFNPLQGQDLDVIVKEKMDYIFSQVDKSKIETGLLSDYGCLLVPPYAFNGVLADTNYVTPQIWKGLYLSMYTTRINNNASLEEPGVVFSTLRKDAPSMLYLQYNRLDHTAINRGLLTFENGRLRETGLWGSLYLRKELFAVTLPDVNVLIPQATFTFYRENYISNMEEMPVQLALCFAPESGYRTVTWGQPISHTFSSFGEKEIKVRIRFSNGRVLESHARIKVYRTPVQFAPPSKIDTTFAISRPGIHSGGKVQIKYATFNIEKKKLMRPLVIADESDIMKLIKDNKEVDLDYLLVSDDTKIIMESINNLYDLVYVDNNNGFDNIFCNAWLFEDAMERINSMRSSSCDSTCILGLGMGGLVARYALKELENRGVNHYVSKFITINTPHKGLNIPIGLQGALRHLNDIRLVKNHLKDLSAKVSQLCDLLDQTAMKQMLTYSIDRNFNYQSDHAEFMRKFEAMGMPAKCRNVAISNGSYEPRKLFQPGERLLELEEGSDLLNILLGFIFSELKLDIRASTLKHKEASEVYYGNLYFRTQLILFIPIKFNCNKETLKSTNDMAALDGALGSRIAIKSMLGEDSMADAFKLSDFCFVPTASALALDDWENKVLYGFSPNKVESCFDQLYASNDNNEYTALDACKDALLRELAPQIASNNSVIVGDTRFELTNLPTLFRSIPPSLFQVDWLLSTNSFRVVSSSGFGAVLTPAKFSSGSELRARITVKGMGISYETLPIYIYSGDFTLTGSNYISPVARRYSVNSIPTGATLNWNLASNLEVVEKKDNYIVICDKSDRNTFNPLWIEAELNFQANRVSQRMNLKRARIERVELECLQVKVVDDPEGWKRKFIYQAKIYPPDLPKEEFSFCWSAKAYIEKGFTISYVKLDVEKHMDACYTSTEIGSLIPDPPILKPMVMNDIISVKPDEYDFYQPSPTDIIVYVPSCQFGDSISGYLKATVKDNYKDQIVANARIWNYYVSQIGCRVSPNPGSTTFTISLQHPENDPASAASPVRLASEPLTIALYNDFGPVRTVRCNASQTDIRMDISDLPDGTYYLNILKGGQMIDRQIVWIAH